MPNESLPIYGLDKELAAKQAAKYDPQREVEARQWIADCTGEAIPEGASFHEVLKDGVLLCKLVNAIQKETTVKFNTSKMPFKQMENINNFLQVAEKIGVPKGDLFQTIDLFENKNMNQVIDSIFALSRNAVKNGFQGPLLGPKLAEKREVVFTEEQLNQGKCIIPLQAGFNGGASQAGMSFGGRRQIMDSSVGSGDPGSVSQQMGFNKGATASGITYGTRREIGGQDPSK